MVHNDGLSVSSLSHSSYLANGLSGDIAIELVDDVSETGILMIGLVENAVLLRHVWVEAPGCRSVIEDVEHLGGVLDDAESIGHR